MLHFKLSLVMLDQELLFVLLVSTTQLPTLLANVRMHFATDGTSMPLLTPATLLSNKLLNPPTWCALSRAQPIAHLAQELFTSRIRYNHHQSHFVQIAFVVLIQLVCLIDLNIAGYFCTGDCLC